MIEALRRTRGRRFFLGALLRNVEPPEPAEDTIVLNFRSKALQENFENELQDTRMREMVEQAVRDAYGKELKILSGNGIPSGGRRATGSEMDSPLVRAAMAMGARIIDSEETPPE